MNWLARIFSLLLDTRVSSRKKLIFLAVVAVYWVFPADLMPFLPIDDLLVTLLGGWLFTRSADNDISNLGSNVKRRSGKKDSIDVEGRYVDDD